MKIKLPTPGRYIIAVSGGVDSMVLLEILSSQQHLELVVAHVDHGIRGESAADAEFVKQAADAYGVKFEKIELGLGAEASEETARLKRYKFLRQTCKKYQAKGIILAHHQDDVIETVFINIIRGTGWRGLSSLRSHDELVRPLLEVTKNAIRVYAEAKNIKWHEDSTNTDIKYLRNFVRHTFMPALNTGDREELLRLWRRQCRLADEIKLEVESLLPKLVKSDRKGQLEISRYWLTMVPSEVADEIIRAVLLKVAGHAALPTQRKQLLLFAKTAKSGAVHATHGDFRCQASATSLIVAKAQN